MKRHPHSFPKDGVGGGSLPPGSTPEPSWNPWTPPPSGKGSLDPLIGKLPKKRVVPRNIPRVGARLLGPVPDGGRREPTGKSTRSRGR
jgi:hypothetical protein